MSDLDILSKTVQKTIIWLKEAEEELNWHDQRRACSALRAVLHALRDRLTNEEVVQLGAQLPTLIRGFYYEGWTVREKPVRDRTKYAFLAEVQGAFGKTRMPGVDAIHVTRAIFRLLDKKISAGEIDDVRAVLPAAVREFWPKDSKSSRQKKVTIRADGRKKVDKKVEGNRKTTVTVKEVMKAAEDANRAVIGLAPTLRWLNEGRVRQIVYAKGLRARGYECPQCAGLFASGREPCSYCGSGLQVVSNMINRVLKYAAERKIQVEALGGPASEAMVRAGGIGALLKTTRAAKLGMQ